eukprot:8800247-Pyramimonas_sp.AAC.1
MSRTGREGVDKGFIMSRTWRAAAPPLPPRPRARASWAWRSSCAGLAPGGRRTSPRRRRPGPGTAASRRPTPPARQHPPPAVSG